MQTYWTSARRKTSGANCGYLTRKAPWRAGLAGWESSPVPAIDPDTIPRMPGRITSVPAQIPEVVAFLSDGAMAHLDLVESRAGLPHGLWCARLALAVAVMFWL
jgi:hypothetical protein